MKRFIFVLVILLLSYGSVYPAGGPAAVKSYLFGLNSNGSMYRNTLKRSGAYMQGTVPQNTIKWVYKLDVNSEISASSPNMMVIKDNILYTLEFVLDYQGYSTYRVLAIDIDSGTLVWQYYLPDVNYRLNGPLCIAGSFLYVPTAKGLFVLDKDTGVYEWYFATPYANPGNLFLAPIVYSGTVYFGDFTGLNALDAETGQLIWRFSVSTTTGSAPAVDPATKSIFITGVDIATGISKVWSLNLSTGGVKWEYSLKGVCNTSLAVFSNKVFVSDNYNYGYAVDHLALDTNSGSLIWKYNVNYVPGPNSVRPFTINATENLIYVTDETFGGGTYKITALNIDTAAPLWSYHQSQYNLTGIYDHILINNYLYLPCTSNNQGVKVIDASTGTFVNEYIYSGYWSTLDVTTVKNRLFVYYDGTLLQNGADLIVCYE